LRPHPLFASFIEASYKHKTGGSGQEAVGSRMQIAGSR